MNERENGIVDNKRGRENEIGYQMQFVLNLLTGREIILLIVVIPP